MTTTVGTPRGSLGLRVLGVALVLLALASTGGLAQAQSYPNRSVKVVVPYPPGGTADAMARIVADALARKWDQPVVVENRAGASGNLAAEFVGRAEPDGYTLLSTPQSPLVINQHLAKLKFDPAEFTPVILTGRVPNAVIVGPSVSAKSARELIDFAKANPEKLTSATQGVGSSASLITEMFQMMAGIKLRQIPYRGSAPALNDLVAGNVDIMFDNLGSSLPLVQGGKLKLLAITAPKRMAAHPDVPTVAEILPGFESDTWNAVVAPPGTSQAIVDQINAAIAEAMRRPEVAERFHRLSGEVMGGSPQDAAAYIRRESTRWQGIINSAGIAPQ
jgi:tripartite-type tricarboxylate transporter receptor subunit TctC